MPGLKPTRSLELLREMAEHGIIEPVAGGGRKVSLPAGRPEAIKKEERDRSGKDLFYKR